MAVAMSGMAAPLLTVLLVMILMPDVTAFSWNVACAGQTAFTRPLRSTKGKLPSCLSSGVARQGVRTLMGMSGQTSGDASSVVTKALSKQVDGKEVLAALESLEASAAEQESQVSADDLQGKFQLVFSESLLTNPMFKGYMPVKEIVQYDIAGNELKLENYVLPMLPFVPPVKISCETSWDTETSTLTYSSPSNVVLLILILCWTTPPLYR
mmetsp:Transcript_48452/g.75662  ORF Transcript_48452/g.75662 Transcript_48452/m.75662 type:complete len:211 (-) Transcript_48452:495-1127(-)